MSVLQFIGSGSLSPAPVPKQVNIFHYGHSFVAGANATRVGTTDFCSRLKNALLRLDPDNIIYANLGHGGFRTGHFPDDGTGNQLCLLAASEVDTRIVAGKSNIHIYTEVINGVGYYSQLGGLFATYTPAQVTALCISDMTAYFQARRAAGWTRANGNLIIATSMNLVPFGLETDEQRQCISDVNTWLKTTAVSTNLVDYVPDVQSDPEIGFQKPQNTLTIGNGADNLHPIDYGQLIYFDIHWPVLLTAISSLPGVKSYTWTPFSIPRSMWWVGVEGNGQYVTWDGTKKVSVLLDQGTWQFPLSAATTARPTWNSTTKSIDFASPNVMTMALNVGDCGNPAHDPYSKQVSVFAVYTCSSTGSVVFELGPNAPGNNDAWVVTNEVGGPKVASYGNVGQSNATASPFAGQSKATFGINHTVSSNQGGILLNASPAPGLAHVDAPNTNSLGVHAVSIGGRAGGSLSSTMSLRFAIAASIDLTPYVPQLLGYTSTF